MALAYHFYASRPFYCSYTLYSLVTFSTSKFYVTDSQNYGMENWVMLTFSKNIAETLIPLPSQRLHSNK